MPPFEYTEDELHQFYEYCVTDTTSMYHLIQALPKDELEPSEQRIWEVTAKINARGVPVDSKAIRRIREVTEWYKKREMRKVSDITDKAVKTVNQTAAIITWCRTKHRVVLPNLQKDTVTDYLLKEELPEKVRELLTLRQLLGKTSTAKYAKLKEQNYRGRVYNNLRYYGAATGRWSGMGFQIHNLPRAKVDNPEETIAKFYNASIVVEDPIQAAKALIRPMIKAPDGKMICAVDYSAIENVLLLWVAGQEDKIQAIREGKDHYKVFASEVYGVPYDEVTSKQRFLGKTGVLGAGYNAAAGAYLNFALGYGLSLSFNEADAVIRLYRQRHPKVRTLWYKLRDCALAAVNHRGVDYHYHDCHFRVVVDRNFCSWLRVKLPSGRSLVYNSPEVRDDKYGPVVTHMGINSYTKQWSRLKLIPGRITENIVQGLARDILAHAKVNLVDTGMDVIASIHDEVVLEVGERSPPLEEVINIVTDLPVWAKDIPLRATGFIAKRYRKD
jgi:DNA polymerase